MSAGRLRRVDEALRQVIGDALASELKDPRVGFVTVTDVKASPDLSHAEVHVSVLGDQATREASLAGLRSAHGYLQRRVASQLRLKRTPTLSFRYDETTDRALRIERLLEEEGPGPGALGDVQESAPRRSGALGDVQESAPRRSGALGDVQESAPRDFAMRRDHRGSRRARSTAAHDRRGTSQPPSGSLRGEQG